MTKITTSFLLHSPTKQNQPNHVTVNDHTIHRRISLPGHESPTGFIICLKMFKNSTLSLQQLHQQLVYEMAANEKSLESNFYYSL